MSSIYKEIPTNCYRKKKKKERPKKNKRKKKKKERKKDLTQREKQAKDENSAQAEEYRHPYWRRCSTHKKSNVN